MPSYGEWQQVTYERLRGKSAEFDDMVAYDDLSGSLTNGYGTAEESVVGGPYLQVTAGMIAEAQIAADVASEMVSGGDRVEPPGGTSLPMTTYWDYSGGGVGADRVWLSFVRCWEEFNLFTVSAWEVNEFFPWMTPGGTPANAIGWQWEGEPTVYSALDDFRLATPVGLSVDRATVTVGSSDDTRAPDVPSGPSPLGFSAEVLVANGLHESTEDPTPKGGSDRITAWDGPLSGSSVATVVVEPETPTGTLVDIEPLDLTSWLDEAGRLILFTRSSTLMPALIKEPAAGGIIAHGGRLSEVVLRWTMQSPTFRWVYATTVAPPCRTYPRTDALSNSPRRYPPPKSRQYGNRATGYL